MGIEMKTETNEYQNMDEKSMQLELEHRDKEISKLHGICKDLEEKAKKLEAECRAWKNDFLRMENNYRRTLNDYEKAELECQKWREKCVGLETSNKRLSEEKGSWISKKTYADLIKENENLDTLVLSFRLVLQEIYRRTR